MENRKFVYVFKNCHGATSIINYDGDNSEVNNFLSKFDAWSSNGQVYWSIDPRFTEVHFECLPEMFQMFNTLSFKMAFERMGVKLVFEYPYPIR